MSHLITETTRKVLDKLGSHDMMSQENVGQSLLKNTSGLKEPLLREVTFAGEKIIAIFWTSNNNGEPYFFPVASFNIDNPSEWHVLFVGSIRELEKTRFVDNLRFLPVKNHEEKIFCLIAKTEDVDKKDRTFKCAVSHRTSTGNKPILPKSYCHWKYSQKQ